MEMYPTFGINQLYYMEMKSYDLFPLFVCEISSFRGSTNKPDAMQYH